MKLSRFVGVAGTNGSGKDTLGRVLEHEGYRAASLSDILRTEATKRGLEHTREHLSSISHELRMELGEGALSQRLIEEASADEKLVITSLRVPGEVEAIQKRGGIIVWIDADPHERYRRILAAHRDRPTDEVSFEEFQRQEAAEMTPSEEGGGLNMAAVRDLADVTVLNDFASKEDFETYLCQRFELGVSSE